MKIKKLFGALLLLVAIATGCGQSGQPEGTPTNTSERLKIGEADYQPYSACDQHGNRVFITNAGDIAATRDPSCPGYLPPGGSNNG